jgi:hypothetical protein
MTPLQRLVHYITFKTTKQQQKNITMTPLQRLVHYITIANFLVNTCNFIGLKPDLAHSFKQFPVVSPDQTSQICTKQP